MVDVRYLLVGVVLLGVTWLIVRHPKLGVPLAVALAAATLAYGILFHAGGA